MPMTGKTAPSMAGRRRTPTSSAVAAKRLTDIGADYCAWADDGKTITWAVGASLFREPLSAVSFEPPKDEKKEGDKKDADAKDADKKDAASQTADAKKDEKKEEKKEEKKLKEQEKDIQEIAVNLEFTRK